MSTVSTRHALSWYPTANCSCKVAASELIGLYSTQQSIHKVQRTAQSKSYLSQRLSSVESGLKMPSCTDSNRQAETLSKVCNYCVHGKPVIVICLVA